MKHVVISNLVNKPRMVNMLWIASSALILSIALVFPALADEQDAVYARAAAMTPDELESAGAVWEDRYTIGWVCVGIDYTALTDTPEKLVTLSRGSCQPVSQEILGFERRPDHEALAQGLFNGGNGCAVCSNSAGFDNDGFYINCQIRISGEGVNEVTVMSSSRVSPDDCALWCFTHDPVDSCDTHDGWLAGCAAHLRNPPSRWRSQDPAHPHLGSAAGAIAL